MTELHLRCFITGNPCGSESHLRHFPCDCGNCCQSRERPRVQVARPESATHTVQELVNIIKQALPMTMRNESPSEARTALAEIERRLSQ